MPDIDHISGDRVLHAGFAVSYPWELIDGYP
jgi:hypothetical protein